MKLPLIYLSVTLCILASCATTDEPVMEASLDKSEIASLFKEAGFHPLSDSLRENIPIIEIKTPEEAISFLSQWKSFKDSTDISISRSSGYYTVPLNHSSYVNGKGCEYTFKINGIVVSFLGAYPLNHRINDETIRINHEGIL